MILCAKTIGAPRFGFRVLIFASSTIVAALLLFARNKCFIWRTENRQCELLLIAKIKKQRAKVLYANAGFHILIFVTFIIVNYVSLLAFGSVPNVNVREIKRSPSFRYRTGVSIIVRLQEVIRRLERDPIFANVLVPFGDNKSRRRGRRRGKTSRPMKRK